MKKLILLLLLVPLVSFSQSKEELDFASRIAFIKEIKTQNKDEAILKYSKYKIFLLKFLNFSDEKKLELKNVFKIQAEKLFEKYDAFSLKENNKTVDGLMDIIYSNEIETRKLFTDEQLKLYLEHFAEAEKDKTAPLNMAFLNIFISDDYLNNYKI
jgi:hypothetical protein